MEEFTAMVSDICRDIEGLAEYAQNNPTVREYLKETYKEYNIDEQGVFLILNYLNDCYI